MVVYKRLLKTREAFTTDTDDILIVQPRYLYAFDIGLECLQNGTTAPTLSEIAGIINKVQVKLSGKIITEVSGVDLLAFNCLVLGKEPLYTISANDNEYNYLHGLKLPVSLPTGEHVLSIRFLYGSATTRDNEKLTLATEEYETAIEEKRYEIPTFSWTPPSTGSFNTALDTTFAGDVEGFLIYSTTIPTTTSNTATVRELRLVLNGEIAYEGTIDDLRSDAAYPADETLRSICDNYIFLDFRKSPIPSGTRIEVQIKSDDTNSVRILPIVRV